MADADKTDKMDKAKEEKIKQVLNANLKAAQEAQKKVKEQLKKG